MDEDNFLGKTIHNQSGITDFEWIIQKYKNNDHKY